MLKFLRLHNKKILVFAGSILMILFLLPQAWKSLGPTPGDQIAFSLDGRNFTGHDVQRAQPTYLILMGLQQASGINLFGLQLDHSSGLEHWMLLVYEAKREGLVGGGTRADELASSIADAASQQYAQYNSDPSKQAQFMAQVRESILTRLDQVIDQDRAQYGNDTLESAVAEIFGVRRLLNLNQEFARYSAPEMDALAIKILDTAIADLSLVEYSESLAQVGDPTAEDLAAHFEKFKDISPSTDGSIIGYRQDAAVQLEAVEVDLSRVRAGLLVDDIEVNKRWRQNKAAYGEDFAAAQVKVEGEIRDERLNAIVHSLEEIARRELFKETKGLEADGSGKKLPENWAQTRVSFDGLAQAFNAEIAKTVILPQPAATVTTITDWETQADITGRSMGRAYATVRGQPMALPAMVMAVRELAADTTAGVQVGIAFGPLTIPNEKLAYVRVMAARPAGPPASIDEVREQVIADWKKLRAFEKIETRVDEIRRAVADAGRIDALQGPFARPLMQVGVEVSRSGATMAGNAPATVANTQAMRDAIMDVVSKWDPTVVPSTLPAPDRVIVVPLPDKFGVGVAIVTGRYPVSQEVVRTYLGPLQREYSNELATSGKIETPFTFDNLKNRLGYKAPKRKASSDESEETPAPKPKS